MNGCEQISMHVVVGVCLVTQVCTEFHAVQFLITVKLFFIAMK